MEQHLRLPTTLNNHGIEQLEKGHYQEAVANLSASLRAIKDLEHILAQGPPTCTCCSPNTNGEQSQQESLLQTYHQEDLSMDDQSCRQCEQSPSELPATPVWSPSCGATIDLDATGKDGTTSLKRDLRSSVYTNPLRISPKALVARCVDASLVVEVSMAIIFNLGLAHHLNAIEALVHGNHPEGVVRGMFGQAIRLYELSHSMQMQEDLQLSFEVNMAIVNNLGHLHRVLGNEERALRCFHHLLSTVFFVQYFSGTDSDWGVAPSNPTLEFFMESVSHLFIQKSVAPAA